MELTETLRQQLIETAFLARRNAYTPYSHYRVGAALLCTDGILSSHRLHQDLHHSSWFRTSGILRFLFS